MAADVPVNKSTLSEFLLTFVECQVAETAVRERPGMTKSAIREYLVTSSTVPANCKMYLGTCQTRAVTVVTLRDQKLRVNMLRK